MGTITTVFYQLLVKMKRTVLLQLFALLAILTCNFAYAAAVEESSDEVLTLYKRDGPVNDLHEAEAAAEEDLQERDPESQEVNEDEVMEKREPAIQKDAEEMEDVEKREEEEDEEELEEPEQEKELDEVLDERESGEETQEEKVEEEKREDTEGTDSEVEDLEARAVAARFSLVDWRGRRINGQREGLLLFNGGTVCDDSFSMNSAHAVCRTMGYVQATRWRHGHFYGTFQSRKAIRLDNVRCTSHHWAACTSTASHNCVHSEDVFLTCQGTGFKLVNRAGRPVTGRSEGLLTYQGGTVCDDLFSMNSAHAICRVMGFSH